MKNKALYLRLFLGLLNEGTKDTEESISSSVKILPYLLIAQNQMKRHLFLQKREHRQKL